MLDVLLAVASHQTMSVGAVQEVIVVAAQMQTVTEQLVLAAAVASAVAAAADLQVLQTVQGGKVPGL